MTTATTPRQATKPYATDAARWQAVASRDARADGAFVYSVKTTGVYCRPACAARQAKRENVRFHATPQDAERAGFRPCKRCRPNENSALTQHQAAIAAACRAIETAGAPLGLEALASAAGMSPSHFHRTFKALTGVTPKGYATAHRAQRVRSALTQAPTVTAAAYAAGFASNGRFYAQAGDVLGMQPTVLRRGGAGESIRFAVGQCSLGAILVAASQRGICAISLGDDPNELVQRLQDRFPQAELVGGNKPFEAYIAQAVALVERPAAGLDLPLDVQGTAFQQRVWKLLQTIPPGETVTYTELAQRAGVPKAVRAVASACAANQIAVAIPCHRVVRQGGALAGYRWGVERKAALLKREAAT